MPYNSRRTIYASDTISVSSSVFSIARRLKDTFENEPELLGDPSEDAIYYHPIGDKGPDYILRLQSGPDPERDTIGIIFGLDDNGFIDHSKYSFMHLSDSILGLFPGKIPYIDGSSHPVAFLPPPDLMRWIDQIVGSGAGPYGPELRQLIPGYSLVLHRDTFAKYKIARLYNEDRNGIPATRSHFFPIFRRDGRAELGPIVWYDTFLKEINKAIVSQWGDSRRIDIDDLLAIESVMIKALEAGAFRPDFSRLSARLGTRYLLETHPSSDFPGLRVDGETPYIVCDVRILTRLGSMGRFTSSRILLGLMNDLSIEVAAVEGQKSSALWVDYPGDLLAVDDVRQLPEVDRRFLASLAKPLNPRWERRSS